MNEKIMDEKLLSQINVGRTADVVYSLVHPLILAQERTVISALKILFRTGKLDRVSVQCHLAELVVLEDLEAKLKAQVRQGERAATNVNIQGEKS